MVRYGSKKKAATKKRQPTGKKSLARKPSEATKRKAAEEPVIGRRRAKRPVAKRPTKAKRPVAKRPTRAKRLKRTEPHKTKRPAAKRPAAKRPVAKRPVAKRPVGKRSPHKRTPAKRAGKAAPRKPAPAKRRGALTRKKPQAPRPRTKKTATQKRASAQAGIQKKLDKLKAENAKLRRKLTSKEKKEQKKRVTKAKKEAEAAIQAARPIPAKREGVVIPASGTEWFGGGEAIGRYRRRFEEIRRKSIRAGEFPKVNTREKVIDSDANIGQMRRLKIGLFLYGNVAEVVSRVEQAVRTMLRSKKVYGIWLISWCITGMGERLIGSGTFVSHINDPDAHAFQMGFGNTGVWTDPWRALERLESDLDDYASEKHTVSMLEWVKIMNFDPKDKP